MTRRPLASRIEVQAYLAADKLECLECGRRFRSLGRHLRLAHATDPATYRVRWGLPASTPLAGLAYRAARAEIAVQLIEAGRLIPNATAASNASRNAGRGERVEWELREQAARAAVLPRKSLPPGSQRADGRDADRAREYQQEYRRKQK